MKSKSLQLVSTAAVQNTMEFIGITKAVKPILKVFHIFLCTNPYTMFTERENQPREYIGYVMANDIEDAFKMAQNDNPNSEYRNLGERSCTVGDLIQSDQGFYMICGEGFKFICLIDERGE